ncbi:MAG: hypothetical protein M1812_003759 [Candelaria pacifica]|nr:MAG: hypothetical protein M1812_003759 [Candelaria pacifica]
MPPQNLQHRRTHNLLLISKLLNLREDASPFTLILDSLEQSGKPLIQEYLRRAKVAKVQTLYVSFQTLRPPKDVDVFIKAWSLDTTALQKNISSHLSPTKSKLLHLAPFKLIFAPLNPSGSSSPFLTNNTETLLILDTLHPLCASLPTTLAPYLSSLLSPTTSLLATYHLDIPPSSPTRTLYTPTPLILLKYLATTIFTTHSLSHVLAQKAARDRSLREPIFGLEEEKEGVIVGLGANDRRGVILEMEFRRKSGRGVHELFFLPSLTNSVSTINTPSLTQHRGERVILLEDHELYRQVPEDREGVCERRDEGDMDITFDLGLTEKQRRDREGVVLPYFDAQREEGGVGGRILYDMGVEDDFDEEEDEV